MRLEIGERFTRVVDADDSTLLSLSDVCSYYMDNWEFAKEGMLKNAKASGDHRRIQYANEWDGRIRLMYGARYPTGLTSRVLDRLELHLVRELEIADKRIPPIPLGPPLRMLPSFEERDYQADAIEAAFKKTRGVIKAPTGSGKTVIGTALIARAHVPTLIVVNKKVLMDQWIDALTTFIRLPHFKGQPADYYVGTVQGQNYEPSIFTVVMAQTMQSWLKRDTTKFRELMQIHPRGWGMLIEDECHGLGAEGRYELNMRIDSFYRYGFSATPFDRIDANLRVEAALGPAVYEIAATKLIDEGQLAKPTIKFHPVKKMYFGDHVKYMDVYREGIVHNRERNRKIMDIAISSALRGKKVLIFVNFIEHGEVLEGLLMDNSITHIDDEPGAEGTFIHANSSHRDSAIEGFKSDDSYIDILIAIDKLIGEGFDYKGVDVVIVADGGKSGIETLQKIGRGTRVLPDKMKVEIHDFADHCKYLYDHVIERIAICSNPELGYKVDLSLVPHLDL